MKKLEQFFSLVWGKKYLGFFMFIAFLGSGLIIIIKSSLTSSLNDILLFNTLVVIFWYSRETMELKHIANKQVSHLRTEHKTNMRPYLRLQKKEGENKLQLVNEGKGVAVNLRSVYEKDRVKTQMPGITAMAAAPNSMTEGLSPARLGIDFESEDECLIEIKYRDIEGRNYRGVFKRNSEYNDKFEIIEQKEVAD